MHDSHILIAAPTQDAVPLAEAKAQLRITDKNQDEMVAAVIAAATNQFDPAGGGSLGRALRPQTWELRLPSFYLHPRYYRDGLHHAYGGYYPRITPRAAHLAIELPYPPLIEIVSIKYDDTNGVEQTLALGTDYRILNAAGLGKQAIAPLYGQVWPVARCDAESVRIRFTSGYDEDENPDPLPGPIKQAIHLSARYLWSLGEQNMFLSLEMTPGVLERRWVVSDTAGDHIRTATAGLLWSYKVGGW